MQLYNNPFILATNLPGVVEVLLNKEEGNTRWEAAVSQTFDGTYTDIHVFAPAAGFWPPIRAGVGFRHPGVTAAQMQYIQHQSKGLRSRGTSWIFGRPDYGLGGPPPPLIEDAQFFLRLRRLDILQNGIAGSSPGAGTTYNDATKDFPTLGVLAGDFLIIESGPNAGQYLIDTPNNGSLTLDGGTPLGGASGPEEYLVVREVTFGGGAHINYLIPRPYWKNPTRPTLAVEGAAPAGADITASEILALPGATDNLLIKSREAAGGNNLIVAFDDDGPELTIAPGESLDAPWEISTHLIALRGAGGAVPFTIVASYDY